MTKTVEIRIMAENRTDIRLAVTQLLEIIGVARLSINPPYRGREGIYFAKGSFHFDDGEPTPPRGAQRRNRGKA